MRTTTATSGSPTSTPRWEPACGRCPYCVAGDICALTKLGTAETGDTVSAKELPLLVAAVGHAGTAMPVAVEAATHGDEDALAKSLGKVAAGDPTLRVERNSETHQLILWCMGEAHAEVVLGRLRDQGVNLQTVARGNAAAGDVRRAGRRPRTVRQTIRRPRPVRHLRHRSRAARAGRRLRVRRQDRRAG